MALDSIDVFNSLAENALKLYGMDQTCRLELLQISENITYLVTDRYTGQKTVLRISRPGYHTLDELNAEILWLREIKNYTPLIVADPIRSQTGAYVQIISSWMINSTYACVMYEFLEGTAPDETNEDEILKQYVDLGETAAYLHRHVKMWNETRYLKRFTWDYESMIGGNARWGHWSEAKDLTPGNKKLFQKTSEIIAARLDHYGKPKDKFGLIHADLRLANLLIEKGQIKVIDFDDCGFGWFLHDLASSVSFIEDKPITEKLITAWIEGYTKVEKLNSGDLSEIDTFVMQRRLQLLAWIASHYDSDPVKELSIGFTDGTQMLAEKYLTKYS